MTVILDDTVLAHHGVKGMKWGVRKERESEGDKAFRKEAQKTFRKNYSNEALDRRLNRSFGPGITNAQYDKLDTHDLVIKKGTEIYRVVGKKNAVINASPLYVSVSQRDRDIYRAVMPQTNQSFRTHNYNATELTYKATETLKSPSEKERVDAFIKLMDTPNVPLRNGKTITGREYLRRTGYGRSVKKMDATRLGLKYYHDFVSNQGMANAPLNSAYYKALKEKGYNAVADDHDRGVVSNEPLIVFSGGSLKNTGVHKLTDREIFEAKQIVKPPDV